MRRWQLSDSGMAMVKPGCNPFTRRTEATALVELIAHCVASRTATKIRPELEGASNDRAVGTGSLSAL